MTNREALDLLAELGARIAWVLLLPTVVLGWAARRFVEDPFMFVVFALSAAVAIWGFVSIGRDIAARQAAYCAEEIRRQGVCVLFN